MVEESLYKFEIGHFRVGVSEYMDRNNSYSSVEDDS